MFCVLTALVFFLLTACSQLTTLVAHAFLCIKGVPGWDLSLVYMYDSDINGMQKQLWPNVSTHQMHHWENEFQTYEIRTAVV